MNAKKRLKTTRVSNMEIPGETNINPETSRKTPHLVNFKVAVLLCLIVAAGTFFFFKNYKQAPPASPARVPQELIFTSAPALVKRSSVDKGWGERAEFSLDLTGHSFETMVRAYENTLTKFLGWTIVDSKRIDEARHALSAKKGQESLQANFTKQNNKLEVQITYHSKP